MHGGGKERTGAEREKEVVVQRKSGVGGGSSDWRWCMGPGEGRWEVLQGEKQIENGSGVTGREGGVYQ